MWSWKQRFFRETPWNVYNMPMQDNNGHWNILIEENIDPSVINYFLIIWNKCSSYICDEEIKTFDYLLKWRYPQPSQYFVLPTSSLPRCPFAGERPTNQWREWADKTKQSPRHRQRWCQPCLDGVASLLVRFREKIRQMYFYENSYLLIDWAEQGGLTGKIWLEAITYRPSIACSVFQRVKYFPVRTELALSINILWLNLARKLRGSISFSGLFTPSHGFFLILKKRKKKKKNSRGHTVYIIKKTIKDENTMAWVDNI